MLIHSWSSSDELKEESQFINVWKMTFPESHTSIIQYQIIHKWKIGSVAIATGNFLEKELMVEVIVDQTIGWVYLPSLRILEET